MLLALVALGSLAVLLWPASGVPGSPPGTDKLVHLLLFAALAASSSWAGARLRVTVPVLLVYGAAGEVAQTWEVVGRSASLLDWVADALGVLLVVLLERCAVARAAGDRAAGSGTPLAPG